MGMLYIFIILLIIFGILMFYFRRKNKKVFKLLGIVSVMDIVAMVIMFGLLFIVPMFDDGRYAIDAVTMREDENIEVNIRQVSSEQIEITLTNHEATTFFYTDYFFIKKYKKDKWKYMPFRRDVTFPKTVRELERQQSTTRIIRWEDYFGKKLKNGKYKLYCIDELEFEIL